MSRSENLTPEQYDSWGASNEGSSAITGESARLLRIPGYRSADPEVEPIARAFLQRVKSSPKTTMPLFSGRTRSPSLKVGSTVKLPLTALSDDEDFARTFATGESAVLLRFAPGIRAMRYSDIEWITAGTFAVKKVEQDKDPYWGTPLVVATLGLKK